MKKYDLYIGCNVNGEPEYRVDYVRFVCQQALEHAGFSGATFTEAVGLWERPVLVSILMATCHRLSSVQPICWLR